jgi:predicted nucleic acid-binding Zn ribbon protein
MADELKDILKDVWRDLAKKQKDQDSDKVQAAWDRIVGPKASAHTRIVYLTKDKIRVNVDSSAWLYSLNLKKERIKNELKNTLGIDDVRLALGGIKDI